jgi:histidinol dehydrogenase
MIDLTKETIHNVLEDLLKRSPGQYTEYETKVKDIVEHVKRDGDEALFSYTSQFDHFTLTKDNILVTKEEIAAAYDALDPELIAVIGRSAQNIQSFHKKQLRNSWFSAEENGTILGMKITPIDRVGVYVPGGTAAYPSSVLMNVIPAKTAGVPEVIMVTPPGSAGTGQINPAILVAADIAGVDKIYRAGGAQAIAAMAFGTKSIPKVNKITGPGNIYVTMAKKAVYGYVGIDSIAGPSEILVLADETANPTYVAADLLSQAEHDPLASAIFITTSKELCAKVSKQIEEMTAKLSRRDIIQKSLDQYGYLLLAPDMTTALEAVNEIASEHVEVLTANPFETMTQIRNAGAIFLGEYSSEPLGDYYAGPNHILPTNGTAKFFSPVNIDDFLKKSSIISYSKEALSKVHTDIERFAESEGLTAHANSIRVRFKENT